MTYWTMRRRERRCVAARSPKFETLINAPLAQLHQLQPEQAGLSYAGSKRSPADALERGQQYRLENGHIQ
jgi:hypothetical protein